MGDFKDVAAEFMYTQEDIWELEKELKTSGQELYLVIYVSVESCSELIYKSKDCMY